jgi:hypothetical protein
MHESALQCRHAHTRTYTGSTNVDEAAQVHISVDVGRVRRTNHKSNPHTPKAKTKNVCDRKRCIYFVLIALPVGQSRGGRWACADHDRGAGYSSTLSGKNTSSDTGCRWVARPWLRGAKAACAVTRVKPTCMHKAGSGCCCARTAAAVAHRALTNSATLPQQRPQGPAAARTPETESAVLRDTALSENVAMPDMPIYNARYRS